MHLACLRGHHGSMDLPQSLSRVPDVTAVQKSALISTRTSQRAWQRDSTQIWADHIMMLKLPAMPIELCMVGLLNKKFLQWRKRRFLAFTREASL